MGAYTPTTISKAGTTPAFNPVAASDTIDASLLNGRPAILQIKNAGGSADSVVVQDNGRTPGGNPVGAGSPAVSVPATSGDREILVLPEYADAANVITVTHSFTTSVTWFLKRLP